MKRDKSLLKLGTSTFLEVLAGRASRHFGDIRLLSGKRDYPQTALPAYRDDAAGKGPLSAVLTACCVSASKCFAIHTVDAPLISDRLLALLASSETAGDLDALLIEDEEHLHPLTGIYSPAIASLLRQQLDREEYRVMKFTDMIAYQTIRCKSEELINANSPQDYERIRRLYERSNRNEMR